MLRCFVMSLAAMLGQPSHAATPASFPAELECAKSGQTITLQPGEYGELTFRGKSFEKPLTIRGGTFTSIRLDNVSGVTLAGVTVRATSLPNSHSNLIHVTRSRNIAILDPVLSGPGDRGRGIEISRSAGFRVERANISSLLRGIVVQDSSGGLLDGNVIARMTGDGINVADSHGVKVNGNSITDFSPLPGFHPDAIQMWSVKGKKPQSDIVITGNIINCDCQGITQFDHAQGGSDGVVVSGNDVTSGYPHGIALYEARGALVADNSIRTLRGSRWRSRLNIFGGSVKAERNKVK